MRKEQKMQKIIDMHTDLHYLEKKSTEEVRVRIPHIDTSRAKNSNDTPRNSKRDDLYLPIGSPFDNHLFLEILRSSKCYQH